MTATGSRIGRVQGGKIVPIDAPRVIQIACSTCHAPWQDGHACEPAPQESQTPLHAQQTAWETSSALDALQTATERLEMAGENGLAEIVRRVRDTLSSR